MEICSAPEPPVTWQALLGYLNFSTGKPDPRFQCQFHAACRLPQVLASSNPCEALADRLIAELDRLQREGAAAFQDVSQARAIVVTVLRELPEAYRRHHQDLLGNASNDDLFAPFFLTRAAEAALAARARDGSGNLLIATLERLNDFVGYRPVPVLESGRSGEVYDRERFRPVPIYLRGVGVAAGRFQALVQQALSVLAATDDDLLEEAQFELALLDEFALDPRPYDHNHPANRRPNHVFGEWDPHHLDALGRHRRFVARQSTLDAMLTRVNDAPESERNERLFEASAVLAGTMLMASALCGRSPHVHDSMTTLSTLVPQIARLRDRFYDRLIATIPGPRGERLRAEARQLRQPFGGARQDLNQRISAERATQLQERHIALLYASLGCRSASRERAARIATPSVRLAAEIRSGIATANFSAVRGDVSTAQRELTQAGALIHRGIACGALADPWSMLGFQGLYPLFNAREDSIHDPRVEELLELVGDLFAAYAQAMGEAAARGRNDLRRPLEEAMNQLAGWWDQFAGYEVRDLPRVHGGESAAAAAHVADALARWRLREEAGEPPDLAFWRQHREGFHTPAAFARVVSALLDRSHPRAAMGLLMAWLSEAGEVPLEDAEHSFHALVRRWMNDVAHIEPATDRIAQVSKFFELLEANAEELWDVPEQLGSSLPAADNEDTPFEAAYEGVTFRDSADDGTEGALLGEPGGGEPFEFDERHSELQTHFQFLATVADLWRVGAGYLPPRHPLVGQWLATAGDRLSRLNEILQKLHSTVVPDPLPGLESALEYDRRRAIKEQLIEEALKAALATQQAARTLRGRSEAPKESSTWEDAAIQLERAMEAGDRAAVSRQLPSFLVQFRSEPLLYVPLSHGGAPDQILRARAAQALLIDWLERFPRMGLLREAFVLVQTARMMEKNGSRGRRVTEFDRLFPVPLRSTTNAVLDLAAGEERFSILDRNEVLQRLAKHYADLWIEHSESIRLSVLESVDSAVKWERVRGFIQRFGRELFTQGFLQLANLRAIMHRGVNAWLDDFLESDEAPNDLQAAMESDLPRDQAVDLLTTIISAIVECFDEYRDYNATTTQSDYGENLHVLLDFLRVKVAYERDNWRLRPLVLIHEVLCRRGMTSEAADWHRGMIDRTKRYADRHLSELAEVEQRHGVRLRSIRDRLQERFVAPLVIDRLSALLEPAWRAAQRGADESNPAFLRLRSELESFAEQPTGVGLEVPPWLERLEDELTQLRREGRRPPPIPSRLTLEDLRDQLLHDWGQALELE